MGSRANRRTAPPGRRPSPGLVFLLGTGVLLAASLAGGQVWAMTGSVPLGVTAGIAVGSLLGAACRPLVRILSISGRRVMGEQRGLIVEDDFEEVVDVVADVTPRGRIVHGVQTRPDKVADSVRSLLTGTRRR